MSSALFTHSEVARQHHLAIRHGAHYPDPAAAHSLWGLTVACLQSSHLNQRISLPLSGVSVRRVDLQLGHLRVPARVRGSSSCGGSFSDGMRSGLYPKPINLWGVCSIEHEPFDRDLANARRRSTDACREMLTSSVRRIRGLLFGVREGVGGVNSK